MAFLRLRIDEKGIPLVTVVQVIGGAEVESALTGVGRAELGASAAGSIMTLSLFAQHVDILTPEKVAADQPEDARVEVEAPRH